MCPETELLLFTAARAQVVREIIVPALIAGQYVLSDRYLDSSTVYQGIARNLAAGPVADINRFAVGNVMPDVTVIIDVPTERVLADRSLDLPFCLAWANETWSRRWDGHDHEILVQQTHPVDRARWRVHFDYLARFWRDERALRVDGRPVFVIYRAAKIPALAAMLDAWRAWAHEERIEAPCFLAMHQHGPPPLEVYRLFDGVIQFQPFVAMYARRDAARPRWRVLAEAAFERAVPGALARAIRLRVEAARGPMHVDYAQTWRDLVDAPAYAGLTTYPGAFMDWDNTPRYRERATIFDGASPEAFERGLRALAARLERTPLPEPFVFLNAWNEWAEGTYLEPDTVHGLRWLQALERVVSASSLPSAA
jgi:hypothetical protein